MIGWDRSVRGLNDALRFSTTPGEGGRGLQRVSSEVSVCAVVSPRYELLCAMACALAGTACRHNGIVVPTTAVGEDAKSSPDKEASVLPPYC